MKLFVILLSFVWTPFSFAQVAAQPQVREALEFLKAIEAETIAEQIAICEIPAPPFKEQQRAEYLRRRFTELGLSNVRIDAAGNVIGERAGETAGQMLALSAHLDTVFPEGTDVTATRTGTTIKAPGIGDDSRGLAVLLAVARVLQEQRITTRGTIMFIGTVGEEGIGDLRGVRHVFTHELKDKVTHFISLDGTGPGITHRAVGSHRYKVTFKGPGGHSYGAFGMPNPVHALGRAVEKISRFEVPKQPKTTFNVGRVEGGTSVNSIAHTVWMEMDLRSESAEALAELDVKFMRAIHAALDEENAFWNHRVKLSVDIDPIGKRPTGEQADDAPIVRAALSADAALGIVSDLSAGSTDANIPISLGIPAITIDGGGTGSGAHSLDETFDTTNSYLGTQRAFLTVLEIVGISQRAGNGN